MAIVEGRARLHEGGARRRYPLWRHVIVRSLASAIILVYLAAMGFARAPWGSGARAVFREWWLLLRCAWAAGPLVLAEIGVVDMGDSVDAAAPDEILARRSLVPHTPGLRLP